MGILACATAGVVFELCGPMLGFSGWPISGVLCWAGWLFAATVLILRGRGTSRSLASSPIVLANAFFAGTTRHRGRSPGGDRRVRGGHSVLRG